MDELISVIIPVYNVEKYLSGCLDSVVSQSYENLQIILIDDGSTDDSGNICDEYADKDDRITVIHNENKGVAHSRNEGIKACKGKYISFVDSDDLIHTDFIKTLYSSLKENGQKISACKYLRFENEDEISTGKIDFSCSIWSDKDVIKELCEKGELHSVLWNKLYEKSLFEGIAFPEGKIHEDELVIPRIVKKIDSIVQSEAVLYYYRKRDESITGKNNLKNSNHIIKIKALEKRCELFKDEQYKEVFPSAVSCLLYVIAYHYFLFDKSTKNLRLMHLKCRFRCAVDILKYYKRVPSYVYKRYIIFVVFPKYFNKRYSFYI